jgi:hypothetical protein
VWGRHLSRSGPGVHDRCYEAVSLAGHSFDAARPLRIVVQGIPKLVHAKIDALVEIDECRVTPERPADFFTSDYLTRMAGKQRQQLEWLGLELDQYPALFASAKIQFEDSETQHTLLLAAGIHDDTSWR